MKFLLPSLTALLFSISTASAQSPSAAQTSTLTVSHAGCPTSPPADVVVTRSAVPAPSCAENGTKPLIVSTGSMMAPSGSATGTGMPSQFTGGASVLNTGVVGAVILGVGAVVFL